MTDDLAALRGRSLLTTAEWTTEELEALLAVARRFEELDRAGARPGLLADELAYAVFFDNSTRTKSAWAGAAARLGMHPVIVDGESTQVAHGETAEETGAMLGMNAHALGIRHDKVLGEGNTFQRALKAGIDAYLADNGETRCVPVVNLQCDVDHPTQTLADLLWLREQLGSLDGRKIAVSWAYSPSYAKPLSVPQGLVSLLPRFGAEVVLARPPGYDLLPEVVAASGVRVVDDMDEAFAGAHAVYPKSWGPYDLMRERVGADAATMRDVEQRALARNAEHRDWICDERRMALTADALYLHCLPADIGAEVTAGVMTQFRTHVAKEANKKVFVIMALLAVAKVEGLADALA
jgi:ornithine carbamoyltransferase